MLTRKHARRRPLVIASAVLVLIGALGWLAGPSGEVRGVEYSPDLIMHRSFRYWQWCLIPITPNQISEWRSDVDRYIVEHGFAKSDSSDQPRWHFVRGFAPGVRGWSGIAKPMCVSVGCWDDDNQWLAWSDENPEFAEIVWPQVVMWARGERYDSIMWLLRDPELENVSSVDELREKIAVASRID